jgi:hypothetical protein
MLIQEYFRLIHNLSVKTVLQAECLNSVQAGLLFFRYFSEYFFFPMILRFMNN